jgi:hypothetical protein
MDAHLRHDDLLSFEKESLEKLLIKNIRERNAIIHALHTTHNLSTSLYAFTVEVDDRLPYYMEVSYTLTLMPEYIYTDQELDTLPYRGELK